MMVFIYIVRGCKINLQKTCKKLGGNFIEDYLQEIDISELKLNGKNSFVIYLGDSVFVINDFVMITNEFDILNGTSIRKLRNLLKVKHADGNKSALIAKWEDYVVFDKTDGYNVFTLSENDLTAIMYDLKPEFVNGVSDSSESDE